MKSRYLIPILAALGIILGIITIFTTQKQIPSNPIPFPPPNPPFKHFVAGEGIVEAITDNVEIATPYSEVVDEVYVIPGDFVKTGDALFKLNTADFESRLQEAKVAFEVAQAEYQKQLDLPRPEDIPPQRSLVKQAETRVLDRQTQFELVEKIDNPKAVSRDEYNQRKYAALLAEYQLKQANEELDLLLAGAWVRDLEIYRKRLKEAESKVKSIETEIKRSVITAPFEGTVLRVNINVGEYAQAGELTRPLLVFGDISPLRIRVDIDEEDVWRVIPGAEGIAYVRGNKNISVPLKFMRIDPYLVPKQALTGENTERVDTRVLQLIYEFQSSNKPIYPGMLMDVYLESKSTEGAL